MVIRKALEIFGKSAFTAVIAPMADFIFLGETDGEKFLRHAFFPRTDGEISAEFFEKARNAGFDRRFVLAASFPGVRIENARYPDMTEEELRETFSWETDRLFRTGEPLSAGYRVLSHTPDGYEILAAAAPEEMRRKWEAAADAASCRISRLIPLPVLSGGEGKAVTAAVGHGEARFYAWESGRLTEHHRFSTEDRENAAEFLSKFPESTVEWLPTESCGEEEYRFWQSIVPRGKRPRTRKEAAFAIGARLADKEAGPNLLPRGRHGEDSAGRRILFLRGACAAAALCALFTGASFLSAVRFVEAETGRATELVGAKAAMEKDRADEEQRAARIEEARGILGKERLGQSFLIALADNLPAGVVLTEIGKTENEIFLKGTAAGFPAIASFEKNLAGALGINIETELLRERDSGLFRFTLRVKEKEASHDQ